MDVVSLSEAVGGNLRLGTNRARGVVRKRPGPARPFSVTKSHQGKARQRQGKAEIAKKWQ